MRNQRPAQPWPRLWLLCLTLSCLQASVALAASAPLSTAEARAWLERIHAAAHASNYQGILVFSAQGRLSSARVAHFGVRSQSYERVEMLDGPMRMSFRHNDRVFTLWPHSRIAVLEEREPQQASLRQVIEPRAADQYEMREQGSDHVAGREATVLLLSPSDGQRFAQRLWIDKHSGLLLRTEVLGEQQQVLESSAFSEVEIGVKPRPQSVLKPMNKLESYRQITPTHNATQLEAEGWFLESAVAGFKMASCTRRILDPASTESAAPPALQTVFSDGLTHVSVFVEPFDPQRHRQELTTSIGATHTLMKRKGDRWWVTVVGDVPASTLVQFYESLERRR
ncbi:MAG: MucB/RseB C-terminal domain-containing protein [Rubrivivax sp.]